MQDISIELNTTRRNVLFDRLLSLGSWAGRSLLPTDTLEILGHGSFFRGKPRPKDVDILIRHTRENTPAFIRFLSLLDKIGEDVTYQEKFSTPQTALLHVFDEENSALPSGIVNSPIDQVRSMFGTWIEGYSWNMVLPQTHINQILLETPEYYTKKLIKKHFPNVNADFFLGPKQTPTDIGLKSGFTVVIWSKSHPDVRDNLNRALTPESVLECAAKEAANFDHQSFHLTTQIDYFRNLTAQLLEASRNCSSKQNRRDWFSSWSKSNKDICYIEDVYERMICDKILLDDEEIESVLKVRHFPRSYQSDSFSEVSDACEQRRQEIKHQWQVVEAYRKIIHALINYKSGSVKTTFSAEQYVGYEVLQRAYSHEKEKIKTILIQLGFLA